MIFIPIILKFTNIIPVLTKQLIYRHGVVWLLLLFYLLYGNSLTGSYFSKIVYVLLILANFAISYYLLLFIIFPFLFKRRLFLILSSLFLLLFFISFDYFNIHFLMPFFNAISQKSKAPFFNFIFNSMLLWSFVFFSASGTYLNWQSIKDLKKVTEKERYFLQTELIHLKHQFNSHLTFNFFNFCYSKLSKISPIASESIECFSEMLHYSLKIKKNEKISLIEEINYIENFIAIQKCITNKPNIQLSVEGEFKNFVITPMILSVFVENAIKHGVINNLTHPILVSIKIVNDKLFFSTENLKKNEKIITTVGIGIENTKQILNIFYKDNHSLIINESNSIFHLELILNINILS